jgi:cation-transporting ATPase 13A3/4/5
MEEGELSVKLTGYKGEKQQWLLYYVLCVLSFGCVYLFARWFPKFWKKLVQLEKCPLKDATWVLIEVYIT